MAGGSRFLCFLILVVNVAIINGNPFANIPKKTATKAKKVDKENIFANDPANRQGSPTGYYSVSFFSNANPGAPGCSGLQNGGSSPFYTEGFATGKCLPLDNSGGVPANSIRYDCSLAQLPKAGTPAGPNPMSMPAGGNVGSAGLFVSTYIGSTTCSGTPTYTDVIPMGVCSPFTPSMLNTAGVSTTGALAHGLLTDYVMATCQNVSPTMPGIPVTPVPGSNAIIESTFSPYYSSSSSSWVSKGCGVSDNFGSSATLPDSFKAYIQTPMSTKLYTQPGCTIGVANASPNLKVGFRTQFQAPGNTGTYSSLMTAHFTPKFDWACFAPDKYPTGPNQITYNTVLYNSLSTATAKSQYACSADKSSTSTYGATYPLFATQTISSTASTGPTYYPNITSAMGCRQACSPIFPRCTAPTGQPTMQPSMQPTLRPSTTTGKPTPNPSAGAGTPSYAPSAGSPTFAPSTSTGTAAPSSTVAPTYAPTGPVAKPTGQPSGHPTMHPTAQPSCEPTGRPSTQPSMQPTQQPSQQPSQQPTRQPSQQPTEQPSQQPTGQPSRQPTSQPTRQPTQQPTGQPSRQPTQQPTCQPSRQPTQQPSVQPSMVPSMQPTIQPSGAPTVKSKSPLLTPAIQPSGQPTQQPTMQPTIQPTVRPSRRFQGAAASTCTATTQTTTCKCYSTTDNSLCTTVASTCICGNGPAPTGQPTQQPSQQPTMQPSQQPTMRPSQQPTMQPSEQPTSQPTRRPTSQPTMQPSRQPTRQPTGQPSQQPSQQPSSQPTIQPSQQPTRQPTMDPTMQPSMQPTSVPTFKANTTAYLFTTSRAPQYGCDATSFTSCATAPCNTVLPGYTLATVYRRYDVINYNKTIAAPPPPVITGTPVYAPTFLPTISSAPTIAPTLYPTQAFVQASPTKAPVVAAGSPTAAPTVAAIKQIKVTQSLNGLDFTALPPAQKTIVKNSVQKGIYDAMYASLGKDKATGLVVNVTSIVTTSTSRRSLLTISSSAQYTVVVNNPAVTVDTLTTTVTTSASAAISTSIQQNVLTYAGIPITAVPVKAESITNVSPTAAPVALPTATPSLAKASSATSIRGSGAATLTVGLIVGFLVTMFA